MSEVSELLSVAEGADRMHVKSATVRAWILKRKIPYVKLFGRVFLRRSDVEALITASLIPAELSGSTKAKLGGKARYASNGMAAKR